MGKIVLSPRILGDQFGAVTLAHINYFIELNKLNKPEVVKDLNSGAKGLEYVRLFDKYFKDDMILRMI
jgi:hypothetical protein